MRLPEIVREWSISDEATLRMFAYEDFLIGSYWIVVEQPGGTPFMFRDKNKADEFFLGKI